jgi:hypothetical protein
MSSISRSCGGCSDTSTFSAKAVLLTAQQAIKAIRLGFMDEAPY